MKKMTVVNFILAVLFLGLLASCDDGGDNTTELRWKNNSGENDLVEIRWTSYESVDDVDQTWSGNFSDGTTTSFKEVDLLNGQGVGTYGGLSYQILDGNGDESFNLSEGDSETITIESFGTQVEL